MDETDEDMLLAQAIAMSMEAPTSQNESKGGNKTSNEKKKIKSPPSTITEKSIPIPKDLLFTLPENLENRILRSLSIRDLLVLRLVSKKMKEIASASTLWEFYFLQLWKEEYVSETGNSNSSSNSNVSAQLLAYRQRHQQHFYQQQKNYFNYYRISGSAILKSISPKDEILPIISYPNIADSLLQYEVLDMLYVPSLKSLFVGYRNSTIHEYSIPNQSSTRKEIVLKSEWKILTQPGEIESVTSIKLLFLENAIEEEKEEEGSKMRVIIGSNSGKILVYSIFNSQQNSNGTSSKLRVCLESADSISNTVVSGSPITYVSSSRNMDFIYAFNKQARQLLVWNIRLKVTGAKPIKIESELAVTDDQRILVSSGTILTIKTTSGTALERVDCMKSLIPSHPSFNKNTSFTCTALHLSGYIAAAIFKEARIKRPNFKVAKTDNPSSSSSSSSSSTSDSFDILIIWNIQRNAKLDSGLRFVKIPQKNGVTITFIQVSHGMDKILIGHSNGTTRIISTLFPQSTNSIYFHFDSEGITSSIRSITCSADAVFIGLSSGIRMLASFLKSESKRSIERMKELMTKCKQGKINTIEIDWRKNVKNVITEIPNANDCHVYLRSKLVSILLKSEQSKITFDEISEIVEDFKYCSTLFPTSIMLPLWIIETCDNLKSNVLQKKAAMDTWAQKISNEVVEQISLLDIQDKLVHGYRLHQQIPSQFSFLESSILPAIQLLQQKAISLLTSMVDSISNQFNSLSPITASNLKSVENLRMQLLKSSILRAESASFKWVTSTDVYANYVSVLRKIDHELGNYYVTLLLEKVTTLKAVASSEILEFDLKTFWIQYDEIESDLHRHNSYIKLATLDLLLNLQHEQSILFEEKCQQIIQMVDALIANCRLELKKPDITVKSLLAAQKRLRELTDNELVKTLEQRHKSHYATIVNLINFASRDIDVKIGELKEIENHLVASVMEQLDSLESKKDKKEEIIAKLTQFKEMLDKFSGSNPDWCKIGLNRIEQLEKDLSKPPSSETKKLDVEDFMVYSDEEIEEEFEDEEMEEGEGDEEENE